MRTFPRPAAAPSPELPLADLRPTGVVRGNDAGWFEAAIDHAIAETSGDLTLDLRLVEFMDGSGMRILRDCAIRLCAAGRLLVLASPAYVVERALATRLPAGHVKIYRS